MANTSARPLVAVTCGTYWQFRDWCYEHDLNPRDPSLRPVLREDDVRGRHFDRIILVGGSSELMAVAESRLRPGIDRERLREPYAEQVAAVKAELTEPPA